VKFKSAPPVVAIDEAVKPDKAMAPLVAVKLISPAARVKPFEAVRSSVEVKEPLFVVVTPVAPRLIADVLVVPMLITPLVVPPVPAAIVTFPPVAVPVPVAFPPSKLNEPPTPVVFPDWLPAVIVTPAPVPEAAVEFPG
jgi:hypothetical protein